MHQIWDRKVKDILHTRPLKGSAGWKKHMSATGLTANGKCRKINTDCAGKKFKILGIGPDYWALHPTTGLCTRLLGFAPGDWAFHLTTGLSTRLLGFALDYWAFIRLLGLAPDYWALHSATGHYIRLLGFYQTSRLFSEH